MDPEGLGAESLAVVEQFRAAFDALWDDPEFEEIDPADAEGIARLESALAQARGERRKRAARPTSPT
ncbi:MAG: hypothetical protein IPP07_21415 [Holophagales bacterium]|nr:hypothetical protein [Holophagales bacterium]